MAYNEFIQNILNTRGRFNCGDEYHERHHIVPKCMNGTDKESNLIDLYAREHFIAHKLLAEENPNNDSLTSAWWMLAHIDDREITPEEYENAKIMFSKICKGRPMSEEQQEKLRESRIGKRASDETRKKLSELRRGEKHPNYGKHCSDETKQKISKSNAGHRHTEEYKLEASKRNSGSNNPNYGNRWTEEQKQQLSRRMSGENHPMYGKHHSEETREKMSKAGMGRPKSDAQKINQSKAMKGRFMGEQNHNHIPIYCPELNEQFWGGQEAHDKYGISCSGISQCLKGTRKSAGKHPITGEPLTWVKLEK